MGSDDVNRRRPPSGQGDFIVQVCRRCAVLTGLGLMLLAGGCQGTGGSGALQESGPSRQFGQNLLPVQSEPPVVEGIGRKTAARLQEPELSDDDDDGASGKSRSRSRWPSGNDKSATRRTLPISSHSDLPADDPGE